MYAKNILREYDKFEKDVKAWVFMDKKLLLEKASEKDEYRKSGKPLGPFMVFQLVLKILLELKICRQNAEQY